MIFIPKLLLGSKQKKDRECEQCALRVRARPAGGAAASGKPRRRRPVPPGLCVRRLPRDLRPQRLHSEHSHQRLRSWSPCHGVSCHRWTLQGTCVMYKGAECVWGVLSSTPPSPKSDSSLGGPCPGMHPRYAWGGRAGRCLGTQPSPDVDMRPRCPLEYLLSHGAEVAGHPLPGLHPAAAARPDSWAFSCPFPSSPLISSPRAGQPQAPCAPATGPGVPGHPRLLPVAQVQLVLSEGCGGVRSRLLQGADGQHGWGCTGLGLLPGEAARDCDPGEQLTPCGVAEGAEVTLLGRGLSPGAKAGGRSAVVSPSETNPVQPSSGPSQAPSTGPDVLGIGRGVPPCHIALLQATNATAARPLPSSEEALPARGADGTSRSVSSSQQTCCSPRGEGPPPHGLPPAPPPSRVRSAAFTGASRLSWGLTPLGRRI